MEAGSGWWWQPLRGVTQVCKKLVSPQEQVGSEDSPEKWVTLHTWACLDQGFFSLLSTSISNSIFTTLEIQGQSGTSEFWAASDSVYNIKLLS